MILEYQTTPRAFASLIEASPACNAVFQDSKAFLLRKVLPQWIMPEVAGDAFAAALTAKGRDPLPSLTPQEIRDKVWWMSGKEIPAILTASFHRHDRLVALGRGSVWGIIRILDLEDLLEFFRLLQAGNCFVRHYLNDCAKAYDQFGVTGFEKSPPSKNERARLLRAFYRCEMLRNCLIVSDKMRLWRCDRILE